MICSAIGPLREGLAKGPVGATIAIHGIAAIGEIALAFDTAPVLAVDGRFHIASHGTVELCAYFHGAVK